MQLVRFGDRDGQARDLCLSPLLIAPSSSIASSSFPPAHTAIVVHVALPKGGA